MHIVNYDHWAIVVFETMEQENFCFSCHLKALHKYILRESKPKISQVHFFLELPQQLERIEIYDHKYKQTTYMHASMFTCVCRCECRM